MGRFGSATSTDPQQDIRETDSGCLGLVASYFLAGLVLVWHQLEESVGSVGSRGVGAFGSRRDTNCLGLVPDDAGGPPLRVEVAAGKPGGRRVAFVRLGARIHWMATGGNQPG